MRVTVLGCSGSLVGPREPASGYLVEHDGGRFVMDMGTGVLGALQDHADPAEVDVVLTHLHGDHCLDLQGLLIWRRFHPTKPAEGRALLYGPEGTAERIGRISADHADGMDDISDTFDVRRVRHGEPFTLHGVEVTPATMVHPVEAYGYRVTAGGVTVAYTGDTAWHDGLVPFARGVDVLFCEATWCSTPEGKPGGMHMSGYEAGILAREAGVRILALAHIPPYGDPDCCLAAARSEFDGETVIARSGMVVGD
ncbi:MBL fold metallo-hydrolase [Corynebacterium sp. 335C]